MTVQSTYYKQNLFHGQSFDKKIITKTKKEQFYVVYKYFKM